MKDSINDINAKNFVDSSFLHSQLPFYKLNLQMFSYSDLLIFVDFNGVLNFCMKLND